MNPEINNARETFEKIYGAGGNIITVRAPGRVNLIGEHTDYNGGFVLPMAIDMSVIVCGRARTDRKLSLHSMDYNETAEKNLDEKFSGAGPRWSGYVEGSIRSYEEESGADLPGVNLPGVDLVISGNVPQGAGLSSSAAVEVATAFFYNRVHGRSVPKLEIALIGQKAEQNYMGVRCGIMDQFASALCRTGCALFLDCRSHEFENVPVNLTDFTILILNSMKSRGLVDSEYNDRRRACEEGVKILAKRLPGIRELRDVTIEDFERLGGELPETIRRKCFHVVTENSRVLKAREALRTGDMETFGALMWASHDSLRDDYNVSCGELDILNEISRSHAGVAGERMTGAGFGGCAVALVGKNAVEKYKRVITDEYKNKTGKDLSIYETGAGGGVECLED